MLGVFKRQPWQAQSISPLGETEEYSMPRSRHLVHGRYKLHPLPLGSFELHVVSGITTSLRSDENKLHVLLIAATVLGLDRLSYCKSPATPHTCH